MYRFLYRSTIAVLATLAATRLLTEMTGHPWWSALSVVLLIATTSAIVAGAAASDRRET